MRAGEELRDRSPFDDAERAARPDEAAALLVIAK